MSTKQKTSSKKKTTLDYWGDEPEPQYTAEQRKRIASYLKDNDENCKECTTLLLIILIGLLVGLSIVGFLAMRNHSSITYKGSHTTYEHASTNTSLLDVVWSKWNWLQNLYFGLNLNNTNSTHDSTEIQAIVALEEELNDFQPIYRNPLLQRLYANNGDDCNDLNDDSLYNFISINHGSWTPSKQYLEEALDFSWADFESNAEKQEIASVQQLNKEDITDKDRKNKKQLKKQFETEKTHKTRRLFAANSKFDPIHAMPNPANILDPKSIGNIDKNVGNIEDILKSKNKKYLKHLDTVRNKHKNKIETPEDVLKNMDLSKYGIDHDISNENDKEKRADLAKLEEEEAIRHPFMTLLTNPGHMHVKCMKQSHREHEVILKANADQSIQTDVSVFNYDSNVLLWYCYLIQIESDAINDLNAYGGGFKVNLTFFDVNMEIGFDYVDIYINSILTESVSGIGLNWETNEERPQFVYYMNSDYIERNGNALEICLKIVTDSSIIKDGFKSILTVDYDDPQITKWSEWSECTISKPRTYKGAKNDRHWNGDCGIGVKTKSVIECMDPTEDRAQCNLDESITEYCIKANCYDFPMHVKDPQHPNKALLFNGHGRVDPVDPDPFMVIRSKQESFNINFIIEELSAVLDQIISRYPDEKALSTAVGTHEYTAQNKLRLGIRLVRSLLLGDTFTVYMTGSSNTAGHENMFMSTWPMQFQSIMRPIWKRVGYKGAAFVVKDHAEGGGLGTMQLGPCIPSLIGDDADVVWWESRMNDHGDAVEHAVENHFRNAITLPRRPLYHIMVAGKNGPNYHGRYKYAENYPGTWISPNKQHGKMGILQPEYIDYGSGITTFFPTAGLAGVNKTKYEEFSTGNLYISWHPGPPGHRVYAEVLAYHYLTSALKTFAKIKDLIDDLTPDHQFTNKPIEQMLEILEDPPRLKELSHDNIAGRCDPVCTNATEAVCLAGYETLGKPRFRLKRWRQKGNHDEDIGKWGYGNWMGNPQSFLLKQGGLGSCDIKKEWSTGYKDSNELRFIFEAKQYGYVSIEGPQLEDVKAKKVEIKINEIDMKTGKVSSNPRYKEHGKVLECIEKEAASNWLGKYNGCNIGGLQPYQKYELVVNVITNTKCEVKNIRVY